MTGMEVETVLAVTRLDLSVSQLEAEMRKAKLALENCQKREREQTDRVEKLEDELRQAKRVRIEQSFEEEPEIKADDPEVIGLRKTVTRLEEVLKQTNAKQDELRTQNLKMEDLLAKAKDEKDDLVKQLQVQIALVQRLQLCKESVHVFQTSNENLKATFEREVARLKSTHGQMTRQLQDSRVHNERLVTDNQQLKTDIESLRKVRESLQERLVRIEKEKTQAVGRSDVYQADVQHLQSRLSTMQKEHQDLLRTFQKFQRSQEQLNRKGTTEGKASETVTVVVEAVKSLQESGV